MSVTKLDIKTDNEPKAYWYDIGDREIVSIHKATLSEGGFRLFAVPKNAYANTYWQRVHGNEGEFKLILNATRQEALSYLADIEASPVTEIVINLNTGTMMAHKVIA